jgi:hypothetical protein
MFFSRSFLHFVLALRGFAQEKRQAILVSRRSKRHVRNERDGMSEPFISPIQHALSHCSLDAMARLLGGSCGNQTKPARCST